MATPPEPALGWRLEIELDDMGRRRTVALDFRTRGQIDAQVAQIAGRHLPPVTRLLEFTNEDGEILAVVARAYVAHTVRPL